tara:strand:- start:85 stop:393 length:309 start_codon:yes stop_codon:yes gene_type:complete
MTAPDRHAETREESLWSRGVAAITSHTGMMVFGAIMLTAVYLLPKVGISVPDQGRNVLYILFIALHVPMLLGMHRHRATGNDAQDAHARDATPDNVDAKKRK